jgi:GDP-L-fucose synthase
MGLPVRILVTGGSGFLGSHVVRYLRTKGHYVTVPDHQYYDFRDGTAIVHALNLYEPETVIHLAAKVGGIGANEAHPGEFLYDNAMMGLQLIEQSRLAGVGKFVTIGTSCEYPANAPQPLRESTIWDGYPDPTTAPYGLAKKMLLAQGQAYRKQYGFNSIHLIPTNLYGPGDNFDLETSHVVPGMIKKIVAAKATGQPSVELWGTGKPTRELCYIEDAARAIGLATERYDKDEPINIGTGVETSISDLASLISEELEYAGDITWNSTKPDGTVRRKMDVSRAEQEFGFRAEVDLAEGIRRTIAWYETP